MFADPASKVRAKYRTLCSFARKHQAWTGDGVDEGEMRNAGRDRRSTRARAGATAITLLLSIALVVPGRLWGVTAQHPVYSLDRGDFVATGELSAGERLATPADPTAVFGIQPQQAAGQHKPSTASCLVCSGDDQDSTVASSLA